MLSKKQKWQQGFDSAHMMQDRGHFASKLAEAYFYADGTNSMRLYEAFPELFTIAPVKIEPIIPQDLDKQYFIRQLTNFLQEQKNAN
jgi:hypothetical protein